MKKGSPLEIYLSLAAIYYVYESFYQSYNEIQNMLKALALTLDAKDHYTVGHSWRVGEYAAAIAQKMKLGEAETAKIRNAGMIHDIGKIIIEDKILFKKGKLGEEEFEHIKTHAIKTKTILSRFRYLKDTAELAYLHHERLDGGGYPHGLKGKTIPLGARILAVADVYDALTSKRPYRNSMSCNKAIEIIKKTAGLQFDRAVVNAFLEIYEEGILYKIKELWYMLETSYNLNKISAKLTKCIIS